MNNHSPRFPNVLTVVVCLVVLIVAAPSFIALAQAAIPLVLILGVVAVALRLVFFHTRKW
jgi:hypothetical protein